MDRKAFHAAAAILWCLVVAGFYYAYNAQYYAYKLSLFERILIRWPG